MKYVKAAGTGDIREGDKKRITIENKDILLANLNGAFYAMDNTCPHMGGSLADGKLDGTNVVCPRHGSVFDITTGKAVKNGRLLFIAARVHDLEVYPVKTEGTEIFIGIE